MPVRYIKASRFVFLAGMFFSGSAIGQMFDLGVDTTPSEWCDAFLPLSLFAEVIPEPELARSITRRTSGLIAEDGDRVCNRLYSIDDVRGSDVLILIVSSVLSSENARHNVDFIGEDAQERSVWNFARVDRLGDRAVRFFWVDPLQRSTGEFNVSFAMGDRVVELKYMNVDDGLPNTFFQSLDELEALARLMVARLGD